MDRRTVSTALSRGDRASLDRAETDDFSALEVLAEGTGAWLSHLPSYAGIALLLHAPLLLVLLLPPLPAGVVAAILVVAGLFVALLVKAAVVKAVIDGRRNLSTDFLELVEALRGAPKVLVLGTRILGRAAVRCLLLLVPGLLYLTETFAAVPALIIEGGSTRAALRRSEKLTGGVRRQVLGICLVIWSIAVGLTLFSGLHKGGSVGSTIWIVVYLCTRALDTSLRRRLTRRPPGSSRLETTQALSRARSNSKTSKSVKSNANEAMRRSAGNRSYTSSSATHCSTVPSATRSH